MQPSKIHGHRPARGIGAVVMTPEDVQHFAALQGVGIDIRNGTVRKMINELVTSAMDSNDAGLAPAPLNGVTTPSITTPIQFLQAWLPGFVRVITAARKIDEIVGLTTVGAFEDEEVVQGILESLGVAVPYGDQTNVPIMSWNANWERRTIVRMEAGMEVGYLEDLRAARVRISTAAEKRTSAALALDIQRNRIGFYGFNGGNNRTYGFLNDPNLPAYQSLPNGASGSPDWSGKTFTEITADIRFALSELRTQSLDVVDPDELNITMAVASQAVDFLSVTNELGNQSVRQWLTQTYPKVRVVSAPELNDANGGVGVMYMFADTVDDSATDDNKTFVQLVPTKFITLGVEKNAKTYVEDYANASAGVMTKRPYAVTRWTGVCNS